ncbi:MAG: cytochrome P450, partial [Hyphomicrobiales bacterium]|nr:cytochrome P450 [Hyphomicrobiales bacterium]
RRAGRTVEIGHDMALFTLDVLERTILSDGLADAPGRFADEMTRFFKVYGRADPADLLGLPKWAPRLTRLGGGGSLQFFEGAISRILERRRARPISEWPRDLLTMLIEARDPESGEGLSEPDIRANVMTFVAAGHETTANALTWTLYLLSQDDEARERAESEVDALGEEDLRDPAKLATLHWTRACLDEAMRLYPPAATLSRQAIGPDEVAGVRIRPGARVLVSPWLVHRHKLNWRDPDLFDPSRFLPENRDSIPRFAYLPFGAGPRVCIGMGFAIQEAMIALATWLRGFRFELAPGHSVMPRQRLTLRPAGGMPMVIKSRRDS